MGAFPRGIVGENVRSVRLHLFLTLSEFANLVGISKTSLVNIEGGKGNYTIDLLDKLLYFIDITLDEIVSTSFSIPENLRNRLIDKHKELNPSLILSEVPPLKYAIENFLIKGDFLNTPRERKEIVAYFEQYGWHYESNTISVTLKRSKKLIKVLPHPESETMKLYSNK